MCVWKAKDRKLILTLRRVSRIFPGQIVVSSREAIETYALRLLAKMEAWIDTLCLLAQPKEGKNKFQNKK